MKGFHRGRRKVEPFFTPMGAGGDDSTRRPETKKRPNDRAFLRAVRPFTEARSIGLKAPRRSRASRCFARTKRRGDARSSPSPGRVRTLRCSPSAPHSRAPSSDAASPRFSSRGDAHSRRRASPRRARLRVPSRLLGWGRSVVRGGRSPRHEALRRADLRRDATPAQVRAAYRAAARTHHPDKGGDARAFAAVRAAFETLGDPARRAHVRRARGGTRVPIHPRRHPRARRRRGRPPRRPRAPRAAPRPRLAARRPVRGVRPTLQQDVLRVRLALLRLLRQEAPLARRRGSTAPSPTPPGPCVARLPSASSSANASKTRADANSQTRTSAPTTNSERSARSRTPPPTSTPSPANTASERTTNDSRDITCGRRPRGVSTSPCTSPRDTPIAPSTFASSAARRAPFACKPKISPTKRGWRDPSTRTRRRGVLHVAGGQNARDDGADESRARSGMGSRVRGRSTFGARCSRAPYVIRETAEDIVVETRTPRWVRAEDVRVAVDARGIAVDVAGVMEGLTRTFWRPAEAAMRPGDARKYPFVVPERRRATATTKREADPNRDGDEDTATVTICMVKRAPTEDEVMYKRGEVQDNRHASSPANPGESRGRDSSPRTRTISDSRTRSPRRVSSRRTRVATGETVVRAHGTPRDAGNGSRTRKCRTRKICRRNRGAFANSSSRSTRTATRKSWSSRGRDA